jgi:AcrR family transcriptional regulator
MVLLWGSRERNARGPRPGLSIDQIAAAIEIADVDGLEGHSMRGVADRLGAGTMSLYRYVPAKADLLDVMIDLVSGETADQW